MLIIDLELLSGKCEETLDKATVVLKVITEENSKNMKLDNTTKALNLSQLNLSKTIRH